MRCALENETEWVFKCDGCAQVNIIIKPEYRRQLRAQVQRTNGIRVYR